MRMSFLHYVNEVRVSQIYRDLIRRDIPILLCGEAEKFCPGYFSF